MHVLLTRPLEDSKDLIFNFKSKGFKVSHLPLLNIQKINYEQIDFNSYEALIFTSSNSIRNLETKNINKETTCFCVGFATERAAKLRGFKNIFAAEGNVNNLKELILQNFTDKQKKILYVSGEIVTQRLDIELKSEGYSVNRLINYKVLRILDIARLRHQICRVTMERRHLIIDRIYVCRRLLQMARLFPLIHLIFIRSRFLWC